MFRVKWWMDRLYPTKESRDAATQFVNLLYEYTKPETTVLDIGAGAGELNAYALKGKVREIVGVDLDPRVVDNPLLDRGIKADAGKLPLEDAQFDVAFSIYVLEHIEDPASFVEEVKRVLKPGGVFLAVTPNRLHYVPILSSLTPTWFHKWYNRRRGIDSEDTFPVFYRMNSRRRLRQQFTKAGFETAVLKTVETHPVYLMLLLPAYLCGVIYERIVNCCGLFSPFRVNVLCAFRKQGAPEATAPAAE